MCCLFALDGNSPFYEPFQIPFLYKLKDSFIVFQTKCCMPTFMCAHYTTSLKALVLRNSAVTAAFCWTLKDKFTFLQVYVNTKLTCPYGHWQWLVVSCLLLIIKLLRHRYPVLKWFQWKYDYYDSPAEFFSEFSLLSAFSDFSDKFFLSGRTVKKASFQQYPARTWSKISNTWFIVKTDRESILKPICELIQIKFLLVNSLKLKWPIFINGWIKMIS